MARTEVVGRLVVDERVASGRGMVEDARIAAVQTEDVSAPVHAGGPFIAPGFIDVHVHGWGGHDAMGDRSALEGMARALARHGVTSFLPTGVTAPMEVLARLADRVRVWIPDAPIDGAAPLGVNLEGPF